MDGLKERVDGVEQFSRDGLKKQGEEHGLLADDWNAYKKVLGQHVIDIQRHSAAVNELKTGHEEHDKKLADFGQTITDYGQQLGEHSNHLAEFAETQHALNEDQHHFNR